MNKIEIYYKFNGYQIWWTTNGHLKINKTKTPFMCDEIGQLEEEQKRQIDGQVWEKKALKTVATTTTTAKTK